MSSVKQSGTSEHASPVDAALQPARDKRADPGQVLFVAQAAMVPIVLVVVWFVLSRGDFIDPVFLPPPEKVVRAGAELFDVLGRALWISLRMVMSGLAIGGVAGISVGLLFGYSPTIRRFFEATLDNLVRPVPFFALIPLFVLWFGIGMAPQIGLVAIGIFLLLSLTTLEAVRNVPQIYVRAALTLGASRFHVYRTTVIPAIVPHLIGSIRLGAAYAWGLDVAAEYAGSQDGLGFIMIIRGAYLDTASITFIVLVYCSLAIIFDQTVRYVSTRLTRWSPRSRRGLAGHMLGN